jgi:hypothetical protein
MAGKNLKIDPTVLNVSWQPNTTYRLSIGAGFVVENGGNGTGNPANANLFSFTTNSTGPSFSSSVPASGSSGVYTTTVQLNFNRKVKAGTGNIKLYTNTGLVHTYSMPDSAVTFVNGNCIINIGPYVLGVTQYYILVDAGALVDYDNFPCVAITSNSTCTFTTNDNYTLGSPVGTSPNSVTYNEDAVTSQFYGWIFTDPGYSDSSGYTLTITPSSTDAIITMSSVQGGASQSFNNTTKVLTLTGNRSQINESVQHLIFTPGGDYQNNFTLTYVGTTPRNTVATKTQSVAFGSADVNITGLIGDSTTRRGCWTNRTSKLFSSGVGIQATATCTLTNKAGGGFEISSISITNGGRGYDSGATFAIKQSGYNAVTEPVGTISLTNTVDNVSVLSQGNPLVYGTGAGGYTNTSSLDNTAVTFSAPPSGGVTATGTLVLDSNNYITGITITNRGKGYITPPTITLSSNGNGVRPAQWVNPGTTFSVTLREGVISSIDLSNKGKWTSPSPNPTIYISSPIQGAYVEPSSPNSLYYAMPQITDNDPTGATYTIKLEATNGAQFSTDWSINSATSTFTYSGTKAEVNAIFSQIYYHPAGRPGNLDPYGVCSDGQSYSYNGTLFTLPSTDNSTITYTQTKSTDTLSSHTTIVNIPMYGTKTTVSFASLYSITTSGSTPFTYSRTSPYRWRHYGYSYSLNSPAEEKVTGQNGTYIFTLTYDEFYYGKLIVDMVAGGGGGGGGYYGSNGATQYLGGGGGGGGYRSYLNLYPNSPAYSIVVGTGGTAGPAIANNTGVSYTTRGGSGGDTTAFGITVYGGQGGAASSGGYSGYPEHYAGSPSGGQTVTTGAGAGGGAGGPAYTLNGFAYPNQPGPSPNGVSSSGVTFFSVGQGGNSNPMIGPTDYPYAGNGGAGARSSQSNGYDGGQGLVAIQVDAI